MQSILDVKNSVFDESNILLYIFSLIKVVNKHRGHLSSLGDAVRVKNFSSNIIQSKIQTFLGLYKTFFYSLSNQNNASSRL